MYHGIDVMTWTDMFLNTWLVQILEDLASPQICMPLAHKGLRRDL